MLGDEDAKPIPCKIRECLREETKRFERKTCSFVCLEQELIGLFNILAVVRGRHRDSAFRPLPNPVTTVLAHSS